MFEFIYSPEAIAEKNLKKKIKKGWMNAVQWICLNPKKHTYIHMIYKSNYNQLIPDDQLPKFYIEYIQMIDESIKKDLLKKLPADLILEIINAYAEITAEFLIKTKDIENMSLKKLMFDMLWTSIEH
jgi:hypothetical protein